MDVREQPRAGIAGLNWLAWILGVVGAVLAIIALLTAGEESLLPWGLLALSGAVILGHWPFAMR